MNFIMIGLLLREALDRLRVPLNTNPVQSETDAISLLIFFFFFFLGVTSSKKPKAQLLQIGSGSGDDVIHVS